MFNSSPSQLERMAGELKCPICLSLYNQAATLSCNHCFCTNCILQSMRRISCCPICKVPTTPREVRSAPQMDSLVVIFKGMQTSAGVNLFPTQPSQPEIPARSVYESRMPQSSQQVPSILRRGRQNQANATNDSKRTAAEVVDKQPMPSYNYKNETLPHPFGPGSSVRVDPQLQATAAGQNPRIESISEWSNGGLSAKVQGEGPAPQYLPFRCPPDKLPNVDGSRKGPALAPFFWVGDVVPSSQDELPTQPTQATQSQGMACPLRPSFSDLKDSDDDHSEDVEHQNQAESRDQEAEFGLPDSENFDSDIFMWTQRPCSPELSTSPFKSNKQLNSRRASCEMEVLFRGERPAYGADDEDSNSPPNSPGVFKSRRIGALEEDTANVVDVEFIKSPPSFQRVWIEKESFYRDEGAANGNDEASNSPYHSQRVCNERETANGVDDGDPKSPCSSYAACNVKVSELEGTNGVDHEVSKSPPASVEALEGVVSTQTPQLLQEPARMTKGTPVKCSKSRELGKSKSFSKACRSLKSSDLPSKPLSKSVTANTVSTRAQRKRKLLSPTSGVEILGVTALAGQAVMPVDVVIVKKLGDLPERKKPNVPQIESRGGEMMKGDEDLQHDTENADTICGFCEAAGDSEVAGPMVQYKDKFRVQGVTRVKAINVHKLCAEWAPDVYFNENEPVNLNCEIRRGKKIKCSSCGKRGAALGCCNRRCKKSFHYSCGRATPGCTWDEDDFVMFCPQHAQCTFPTRKHVSSSLNKEHILERTDEDELEVSDNSMTAVAPSFVVPSQKWHTGPASKWVLCGSGLDSSMKGKLHAFASLTGASLVIKWTPSVTHVITGTDEEGAAKRTLKFLMGVLEGKWIVNNAWMDECIRRGQVVGEKQFEVHGDTHGFVGGPKRGRSIAEAKGQKLLEGLSFYFCGDFTSVSKGDLQSLIIAGRGVILHRKPLPVELSLFKSKTQAEVSLGDQTYVLYDGDAGKQQPDAQLVEEATSIAVHACAIAVSHSWLLDSVAACLVQDPS